MSGLFGIYAVLYIFQFFSKSVLNVVRQFIRVNLLLLNPIFILFLTPIISKGIGISS